MKLLDISRQQFVYSLLHSIVIIKERIDEELENDEELSEELNNDMVVLRYALFNLMTRAAFEQEKKKKSVCY
jgi:hypothetical protein